MKVDRPMLKANRYEILNKLGEGGMGVVYQALDRLTNQPVALKELKVNVRTPVNYNQTTLSSKLLSLANEFQILGSLRHPNIVSVLSYGFDETRQPYFTMDLLTGVQTITEFSADKSVEQRTKLIVQLLQAVAYLHQRNIIHRDLKPFNILVTNDGSVKVLDFGLALATTGNTTGSTTGTLSYMAPELLQGAAATYKSDFYSIGLIMYEIFAQTLAFDVSDINQLVKDVLFTYPDLSLVPDTLAPIVGRLIHKDPDERYDTITEVMVAFQNAMNYTQPMETLAVRESFLQAANFVGRKEEMAQVWQGIEATLTDGAGGFVLIGGESGVGKSRFVSELRVRAMIEPILVIRARAIQGASSLYYLWRKVIERLVLITEVDDWEASALKRIVPDIGRLLDYDVPDPEELPGTGEQERTLLAITNLLKRQTQPMLFILEDLQWAKSDSLAVLERLTDLIDSLPIFLLGTFRSDEAPELASRFDSATTLMLSPLDTGQIQALMQSILGEIGDAAHIVEFLKRETEGNALFVVEVIRALADEAGNLRAIAEMPLPEDIKVGGILAILKQRLSRLPKPMHNLLQVLALYGRDIDLKLAEKLADDVSLQEWLQVGENAAVLRVEDENWIIAHDKIREQLVVEMAQDETRWQEAHHKISLALDDLYQDDPTQYPTLAYHWTEANVADKAVHYNHEAAKLLVMGGTGQALTHIDTAEKFDAVMGTISLKTRAFRSSIRGLSHYLQGDTHNARIALEKTLAYMDLGRAPASTTGAILGALKQVGRQIAHRFFPDRFLHRRESDWVDQKMMLGIRSLPMIYSDQGAMANALWVSLLELNSAEAFKLSDHTHPILSYANMHFLMSTLPFPPVARHYRHLVMKVLDDPLEREKLAPFYEPVVRMILGFTDMLAGKWQAAIDGIETGLDAWRDFGDLRNIELTTVYLGNAYQFVGDLPKAQQLFTEALQQSLQRKDPEMILSLSLALASLLLRTDGMTADNHPTFDLLMDEAEVAKRFEKQFDVAENYAFYYVIRANHIARIGDADAAWELLQRATSKKLSFNNKNVAYHDFLERMAFTVSLLLKQMATNETLQQNRESLLAVLDDAIKGLETYGKAFVFSNVSSIRYKALSSVYRKLMEEALITTQHAIDIAKTQQIPYEEAMAFDTQALLENLSDAERTSAAQQAQTLASSMTSHVYFLHNLE